MVVVTDNYKELMGKKEAFLKDEDIWHMAVARRRTTPCTTTHDGSKPKVIFVACVGSFFRKHTLINSYRLLCCN